MTQSILNFFCRSGWSVGTKLPGYWQENKKTRRTFRQQLTIVYCSMFRLHTVDRQRQRQRKKKETDRQTDRESIRVNEQTQKDIPIPTELSERKLLTSDRLTTADKLITFSKLAHFYIFKFRISVRGCHLVKLLHHLSRVQSSLFSFSPVKPVTRCESILFTFWLPVLIVMYSLKLSSLTYISAQRF